MPLSMMQDFAGTTTCKSVRTAMCTLQSLVKIAILLCLVAEGSPYADDANEEMQVIRVDQGNNFTLPCGGFHQEDMTVMWVHEDKRDASRHNRVLSDGSIFFPNLKKSDSGVYSCSLEATPNVVVRVRIVVLTPPSRLRNVTVTPNSISATVDWEVGPDGGYPIKSFQIAYKLINESDAEWKTCLPALISPKERQYTIYHLLPNSTYVVKIWANNKLGAGYSVIVKTRTRYDPQEIELGKRFLEGIDSFDVRIWILAVSIVIATLLILGVATCCLFYREYNLTIAATRRDTDGETIELMPNIILNPGFDFQSMEVLEPDENSNDTTAMRINNNSVIHPSRV